MDGRISRYRIPDHLLYGFGIAAIGGPLAIIAIYFFTTTYLAGQYTIYAIMLGVLAFIAPLAVWYRYSKKIASSGGLYTFVKEAVGERIAKVQGWIWIISYFLYLPYTVVYISYQLVPAIFSNAAAYLPFIDIGITALVIGLMLLSFKKVLYFIFATAIVQLLIIAFIVIMMLPGAAASGFAAGQTGYGAGIPAFANGTLQTPLLFLCISLVLFLGGEAKGGARSMRKALVIPFAIVAVFFILGSMALIGTTSQVAGANFPIFQILNGSRLAYAVALLTMISIIDLVVIEYTAITRLAYSMLGIGLDRSIMAVALLFVAFSLAALLNPNIFYYYAWNISDGALYLSLLMAFVAYPFFARRGGRLGGIDILIASVASALMLYGLYTVVIYL